MNIKKEKKSWFFFTIYVITYLYLGVCIGNTMSGMLNLGGAALSCIVVVMVILLAFVGCAAALIVLMKARPKDAKAIARQKRRAVRNDSFFVKELLPALASYLLVVISRGIYIGQFSGGKLTGNVGLYEQVCSRAGVDFGNFLGVERLYAYLLKGFCILLGNVPDAVYILNLICQVILVFCCYLFLRVAAGKAAAVASAVLFLGIPYFYHMLTACEPAQLFMALCAVVIGISAFAVKRSVFELGGKGMLPAYLICGLIAGMLVMLDLTALLIPLTVIVVFLVSVRGRRAELIVFVLGVLLGIPAGLVLLNVGLPGEMGARAMEDLSAYFSSCGEALSFPTRFLPMPEDLVLLCVIAFGGIAAVLFFWCEHDVLRIIAVPYFGMILFAHFLNEDMVGLDTGFLIACLGVLTAAMTVGVIYLIGQPVAEVETSSAKRKRRKSADADDEEADEDNGKEDGVAGAAAASKNKKVKEKPVRERKSASVRKEKEKKAAEKETKAIEKETKAAEKETKAIEKETKAAEKETKAIEKETKAAEKEAKASEKETKVAEKEAKAAEKTTQAAEKESTVEAEKKETSASADVKGAPQGTDAGTVSQPKKPNFIENPLPLPKKREHREMDYTYEVLPDRMHYDVEVRDGDDFDR